MTNPTYKRGAEAFSKRLRQTISEALAPPSEMTLSEWAEAYAHMPKESAGTNAGKFSAVPFQVGMMDAVTDPATRMVTVMKSARVGYTVLLSNVIGYYISQEPAAMLLVQPTQDDADDFSRATVAPMLQCTPVLKEIAGDLTTKSSGQTISKRSFRNGSWIKFIGANSPGGFRRITAQIVMFDEVDGYPSDGAGDEGDQITLGIRRTTTEWNSKIILGSTPGIKGESRIERSFEASDQRHYYVPCPHCGEMQTLDWHNLLWDKTTSDDGTVTHHPETAYFACKANGCIIEERYKGRMISAGEWRAHKPFQGHAGFFIWAAYSPFPKVTWASIAAEFVATGKDPVLMKPFYNTVLGRTWEEGGKEIDPTTLISRVEPYDGQSIPSQVKLLTAGVDTQDDRLEVSVIGWGDREESWVIETRVLHGDPSQQHVWQALDGVLKDYYTTDSGRRLRIMATSIDSGGHHTERVYAFCRTRRRMNVRATKGAGGARPIWPRRSSKGGVKGSETVYIVGVDSAKEAIHSRLRIPTPGPGYIHFSTDCDQTYFDQLTAEKCVTRWRAGKPYRVWVPTRERNEALDMFVYAFAALRSLNLPLESIEALPKPTEPEPVPLQPAQPHVEPPTPPKPPEPQQSKPPRRRPPPAPRGGGWLNAAPGTLGRL